MEQHEGILETAIVSARKGRDARLLRVLETRQKFKLRQEGCLSAWTIHSPRANFWRNVEILQN